LSFYKRKQNIIQEVNGTWVMTMVLKALHVVAELYGCPVDKLNNLDTVKSILNEAVKTANLKKIDESYHHFSPTSGITGFILLKTSHISVHSWPEYNYAAVDIFTCGDPDQGRKAVEVCKKLFGSEKAKIEEIIRG